MTEVSDSEVDYLVECPSFIIPRLWPIFLGIGVAFGSLFVPWLVVGKSSGEPESLVPADSWQLLALGCLLSSALIIGGFIQWRQRQPSPAFIQPILAGLAVTTLVIAAIAELIAAVIPSIGSLLHIGHYSLAWTTGVGPWLAMVGFSIAAVGITLPPIEGAPKFAYGTGVRSAMVLAFVAVFIGRNYSWFSIGWNGHHLGIPSWYIPVIGNDVRGYFIIWLVALFFMRRRPLLAYTMILTSTWLILLLILVTKTLLQSVSLKTVDQWLGPSVGKFTTHIGAGLTLSLIGVITAAGLSLLGLWQAGNRRVAAAPLEGEGSE